MRKFSLEHKTFLLILIPGTLAFGLILVPFYGAVFWAVILAIIFAPLHRRLLRLTNGRRNLAAFVTLMVCVVIAVLPMILISMSLVQQAALVFEQIRSGQIDFGAYAEQIRSALPEPVHDLLERVGVGNFSDVREGLSRAALTTSQFVANRAVNIGQNTVQFVIGFFLMLYLLF